MRIAYIHVGNTSCYGVPRTVVVCDEKRALHRKCDSRHFSRFHSSIKPIARRKNNFADEL
jgi:hypothetical protein